MRKKRSDLKTKKCTLCKNILDISKFLKSHVEKKSGTQIYKSKCTPCYREYELKRYYLLTEEQRKKRLEIRNKKFGFEYNRKYRLLKRYNISFEDWQKMLVEQNGMCFICNKIMSDKEIRIDHDHKTNKVRKILCHNCNTLLGHAKEDYHILENAILYLKSYQ